jgi:hypothetical protein
MALSSPTNQGRNAIKSCASDRTETSLQGMSEKIHFQRFIRQQPL